MVETQRGQKLASVQKAKGGGKRKTQRFKLCEWLGGGGLEGRDEAEMSDMNELNHLEYSPITLENTMLPFLRPIRAV